MEVTMGDGEYVGNASVHWSIDYGNGQKVRVKENEPRRPRKGDDHNVSTDIKVLGRDEKTVQSFEVTLRFESRTEARRQLDAAIDAVNRAAEGTSFFLTFKVPATVNGTQRSDPDTGPRPDVGVHWE
jgi:hypothetical protein